ncbi:restriction endonuclease subunit S [Vibrio cholerae]|nr:restriction endonuclease subunit S [Vibrio cholerae]
MSWQTVKASELIVKRGGSVNPSTFPDETFELFSIPAFDAGVPEISIGSEIGSSKSCIQPNDVLLSKIVPHIRRCWVVTDKKDYRQIGSGEWIIFRDERFYPKFLKYFLTSDGFHHQFMNTVAGVGGSLVRARPAFVEKIEIPLPPLDEQKRIAAILDKADAIRQKRKQAITLADEFLRSVFLEMFGDPVTNPKGWEEPILSDIADVRSGVTKGKKLKEGTGITLPYMRVANVQDGYLDLSSIQTITVSEKDAEKCKLLRGDILLTEGGDPDKLGRGHVWNGEIDNCIHQNHIFSVRVKDEDYVRPAFLSAVIGSQRGKRYFLKVGKQTTGIATINKTVLSEFCPIVPPLELQDSYLKIASRIKRMQTRKHYHEVTLFPSLSQKAFSGQL